MKTYYINTIPQPTGEHHVHTNLCLYIPGFLSRRYLGEFRSAKEAMRIAEKTFPTASGCTACCDTNQTMKNNKVWR
jgi:hypothetical protein